MFKGKAGKLLLFGITEENVRRLKKNEPILIDLNELRAQNMERVIIFYAKDEDELIRKVAPYITKDTKIHESK